MLRGPKEARVKRVNGGMTMPRFNDAPAGDGATREGLSRWEAVANGEPGFPKGCDLESVELLNFLKRRRVRIVVGLTAAVH